MTAMIGIIVSLISAGATITSVLITVNANNKDLSNKLVTAQAVTDTKLENLADEVRKHNDFATRIPAMEVRINTLERDIEVLRRQVELLTQKVGA